MKNVPKNSIIILEKTLEKIIINLRCFLYKNILQTNEIIKDWMINYIKNLSNGLEKVDTHFLTDIISVRKYAILKDNFIIIIKS